MEIDKSIGEWSYYANDVDDMAYYFYIIEGYNKLYPIGQYTFMYNKSEYFRNYYHKSIAFIRRKKIGKIISNGNR